MPPANDLIANATVINTVGSHVFNDTTVGAGFSDEGSGSLSGYNQPDVWYRIEIPAGTKCSIRTTIHGDSGFLPYGEYQEPTTDPPATDADLAYDGDFIGDGDSDFGPQDYLGARQSDYLGSPALDGGTVVYLFVGNWPFDGSTGTFTLTVEIVLLTTVLCIQAPSVINPDSATASVVGSGTRVRETWAGTWQFLYPPENIPDATLKWTWAGVGGLHRVEITGQMQAAATSGEVQVLLRVNGREMIGINSLFQSFNGLGTSSETWFQYDLDTTEVRRAQSPYVAILPGDIVEAICVSKQRNGSFVFQPFEIERICFYSTDGSSAACDPTFSWPTDPMGDQWGDPSGFGGQALMSDDIKTFESPDPASPNRTDYDYVVLPDGTVYFFAIDMRTTTGGTPPSDQLHYAYVKKYDPGTDTWSELATYFNNGGHGSRAECGGVKCELGPDGLIYLCWWEFEGTYKTGHNPNSDYANNKQFAWYMKTLDPSTDTFTALGGANFTQGITSQNTNLPYQWPKNVIGIHDASNVYVGFIEQYNDGNNKIHQFVFKWNGSSWSDLSLPAPSEQGTATPFDVEGHNSLYDTISSMAMLNADGPADYPSLFYSYRYTNIGGALFHRSIYIEWNGSSWVNEIVMNPGSIENSRRLGLADNMQVIDPDLLWDVSTSKLLLVCNFKGSVSTEIWDILKISDDHTTWEPYDSSWPASVVSVWTAGRCFGLIGPDGNVYRSMMTPTTHQGASSAKIVKRCPGFGDGYAAAFTEAMGHAAGFFPFQESFSEMRMRLNGTDLYVVYWLSPEDYGATNRADGVYMFKLPYSPCGGFKPRIIRRTFS